MKVLQENDQTGELSQKVASGQRDSRSDSIRDEADDDGELKIFSTCGMSKGSDPGTYLQEVQDVARWSERAGCRGILVYADNGIVDPWLVSQVIIQSTDEICPLVAVQPTYMHPYAVAKMVTSLAFLHGRKLCLNMIAGGFRNDLLALNDPTPHDERYDRLVEYTQIIQGLLDGGKPLSFEGAYYQVNQLQLTPRLPEPLRPEIFISGSSEAGLAAAAKTGATAVKYPKPSREDRDGPSDSELATGVRVGIIARDNSEEAWKIAEERFPEDRKGRLTHELAMKTSDSHWHQQLSRPEEKPAGEDSPYWMRPFLTYKTFCPYLVGSHEQVAREISSYAEMGHRTFIMDIPPCEEELEHIGTVFEMVTPSPQ